MRKLDSNTFDELVRDQQPFAQPSPCFDLRDVEFISPAGLVQLAAATYAVAQSGSRARVLVDDPTLRSYLARAGFVSVIDPVADIVPAVNGDIYEYLRGSNPMLLEVTRLESAAALPDLLEQILWVLQRRLQYRDEDAFDIATAVSEITQNTFDHNANTSGFISMQVYRSGRPFLEIGIADYGDGLASTLRRNPKNIGIIQSDADAIKHAIKLGTSEHDDPTRGTGLHYLLEITYKHEGLVQIRTGNSKVRYRMDKRQGWFFSVPPMSGVQIALNLPSKRVT